MIRALRVTFFVWTQRWPFVPLYALLYALATRLVAWRLSRTAGVVAVYLRGSAVDAPVYGLSDLDFLTVVADSRPATVLRVYDQLDLWHRLLPMVEAGGRTGVLPQDRLGDWLRDDPLLRVRARGARRLWGEAALEAAIVAATEEAGLAASAAEGEALLAATWATTRRTLAGPPDAGRGYALYKAVVDVWRALRLAAGEAPPVARALLAAQLCGAEDAWRLGALRGVLLRPLASTTLDVDAVVAWLTTMGPPAEVGALLPPRLSPDGDTDPRPRAIVAGVELEVRGDGGVTRWIEAGPARLPLDEGRAELRGRMEVDGRVAKAMIAERYARGDLRTLGRRSLGRVLATLVLADGHAPLTGLRPAETPLAGLFTADEEPPTLVELQMALRAIARRLDLPPPPDAPPVKLSVIVCTRNRAELLARTLDALRRQRRRADEIVIVDNGSTDGTARLLDATHDLPLVRVYVAEPSIPVARNAGAAAATGDIFCYTDDDALPAPGWLACIEATFARDPAIGMVGGDTHAIEEPGVLSAFFAWHMRRPEDPLRALVSA